MRYALVLPIRLAGDNMPKITVREAADQNLASATTIRRAIRDGRLSAEKNERGATVVDSDDLEQLFGAQQRLKRSQAKWQQRIDKMTKSDP